MTSRALQSPNVGSPHQPGLRRPAATAWLTVLALSLVTLLGTTPAHAQRNNDPPAAADAKTTPGPQTTRPAPSSSETTGTVTISGRPYDYRAAAARLTLTDGAEKPAAEIFHVAYRPQQSEPGRPVTFVFNGGPGAASAFLHLGALGPRIVAFGADGNAADPGALIDNPDTWLGFTDLVFVDPVATGYSRARSDDVEKSYLGTDNDADAMAAFIRLWLAHAGRGTAPVFIAGESYGGFRAALLASRLLAIGVQLKGLVLISPALDFALIRGGRRALLPRALVLPSLAAAHREQQLGRPPAPTELADVEAFARGAYLTFLAGRIGRDPQIEERVARETGLPESLVARHFSRVSADLYLDHRERETGRTFSRYDGTVSAPVPRPSGNSRFDPVLEHMEAVLTSAFTHYARTALGYQTDLAYHVLNHDVFGKWTFGRRHGRQGYASALDALQDARTRQPALRILVVNGTTDLVTTYMASRFMIDQLEPIDGAAEPEVKAYAGGHMMYLRPEARRALTEDARKTYAAALGAQ